MRRHLFVIFAFIAVAALAGCGFKRPPANVFPGSDDYIQRVQTFKYTPPQAYELALEQAKKDNKLQFLSRRPTVIVKRWYVFSMPAPTGANLQGYHVNGDSGQVKFVSENKTIQHSKR